MNREEDVTQEDIDAVLAMLVNPVYAGVGPYPAIVTDIQWIVANEKVIAEIGLRPWLERMLAELRGSFPANEEPHKPKEKAR